MKTGEGVEYFDSAGIAREAVLASGFIPLCAMGDKHHFVRGSKRCWLRYEGDFAYDVPLDGYGHVRFIRIDDTVIAQSI